MTLDEIGLRYETDKSSAFHCYLDLYDECFQTIRNGKNQILEIGIFNGDSLKMFSDYFENSVITAFDILDKSQYQSERTKVLIGDQSDRNFLDSFHDGYFDVILDDGSHKMEHQQISIGVLFRKLKSGGIYVLEDLHTSYKNYIETQSHGLEFFGLNVVNSTVDFLEGLKIGNGPNVYLTESEYSYLKGNVKSVEIYETARRADNNFSMTSIIIKK
jgi:hypothetical protein